MARTTAGQRKSSLFHIDGARAAEYVRFCLERSHLSAMRIAPRTLSASLRQPEIAKLDLRYADGDYSGFQLSIRLPHVDGRDLGRSQVGLPWRIELLARILPRELATDGFEGLIAL